MSSSSELTKCSDNISPTIVCLRTAGDHDDLSLEVEVKRSSHDEQHASASWKSNDLFYFPSCTSDREGDGCPECPKQPIYNSSFKTTSFCGSNLHRERIVAAGGRSQRSGCSILADGEETGEVWSRARKGGGMNMKPALLLGLWCLTLSHSTGESAAQTRLL